ncbi:hypothetical protein DFR79_13214 [Halanaerobium saccharolyticum]|jgi:hypothetical protein|uniref:Uncharacterized protein n=1 Tax=Halanaerobium saccharolyticum TaxID=43595 RepID=A0A4R6LHR8_9FIRM|nr:hypothetical protein [Halanaerobium saccharolyticum]TDO77682.1 hypothetical protein DFR79_13214 [Halanaerobium saccharolyticum]
MLQEKINIWDHTLGLRFSALVPKLYRDNFDKNFLEEVGKAVAKVGGIQEKYKNYETGDFREIKKEQDEIKKISDELLEFVYCLNKADNDIFKFPTYDEWLNQFDKPNLLNLNWLVDLVIRLEENFSGKEFEDNKNEKKSKKKLKET